VTPAYYLMNLWWMDRANTWNW